ncbi:MAG: hypothetical protein NVV74_05680 [Magnetospirillum sp.]|nr:hypothetical protein [Magnetospirillum sp.]
MAEIVLIAISARDVGERQVFDTGLSTVGQGGEDYLCGHCGHKMLTSFNFRRLEVPIVFKCGQCGGHNVAPEEPEAQGGTGEGLPS